MKKPVMVKRVKATVKYNKTPVFRDGQLIVDSSFTPRSNGIYYILPCTHLSQNQSHDSLNALLERISGILSNFDNYFEKEIIPVINELCSLINNISDVKERNRFYSKIIMIIEIYENKIKELAQAKISGKPFLTLEPEPVLLYKCESELNNLKNELNLFMQSSKTESLIVFARKRLK